MHRLIVALLAAFDAAVAVAAAIAATLASLTLVWVFGLGDTADWAALWPASAVVWQLGHLVPLDITLPGEYLAATGISPDAASFVLSLAPLAFATFTAIFAARSGARASRADAWVTGLATATVVVAALSTLIALTSRNAVAGVELWQAVLFPTLLFAVPALVGGVVTEWREAGYGFVARVRDRVEAWRGGWGEVIGVSVRGSAAALTGLIGAGALVLAVALIAQAGDVVALYQAGNLDLLGAIGVTIAQFAYLPTLVVWSIAFISGPGFAFGEGTAVSPSGTQVGVVPGVPILGVVPESTTSWWLLLVLLPVAVGAVAGWIARSRMLAARGIVATRMPSGRRAKTPLATDASTPAAAPSTTTSPGAGARRAALEGLLATPREQSSVSPAGSEADRLETSPALDPDPLHAGEEEATGERRSESAVRSAEPFAPRLVIAVAIGAISAGTAALLSLFASGSLGPGRLADVGPLPGPVALAVGVEVLVGASIVLLSSRKVAEEESAPDGVDRHADADTAPIPLPSESD